MTRVVHSFVVKRVLRLSFLLPLPRHETHFLFPAFCLFLPANPVFARHPSSRLSLCFPMERGIDPSRRSCQLRRVSPTVSALLAGNREGQTEWVASSERRASIQLSAFRRQTRWDLGFCFETKEIIRRIVAAHRANGASGRKQIFWTPPAKLLFRLQTYPRHD